MKARVHLGECKLCGKKENLTFEHVPPQTAFNSFPVKTYAFDETIQILSGAGGRKPWDFGGLYGKSINEAVVVIICVGNVTVIQALGIYPNM